MSAYPHHLIPRLRVYTASKISQAPRWLALAREWPEVEFVARWPHLIGHTPDEGVFMKAFWQQDHEDVAKAHVVLTYGEPGEHLRGALVEAGMGIALGKTIIVVGDHPDYGTWQEHPLVFKCKDLSEARSLLQVLAMCSCQ